MCVCVCVLWLPKHRFCSHFDVLLLRVVFLVIVINVRMFWCTTTAYFPPVSALCASVDAGEATIYIAVFFPNFLVYSE